MSEAKEPEVTSGNNELDLTNMTREQALEYMGLGPDADIKEIDDRFWQMSKKFRGSKDPEAIAKEDEISAVYDIASGRRDTRVKEAEEYAAEPKYFGWSKGQWQTYVEYTWYKWLLGVILAVTATITIIGLINNQKSSCSIIVFGHMYFDNTYMTDALVASGIKGPYIGTADVVVPNDEGFEYSETGNETLNAMFYTDPVVLIVDEKSYPYYFSTYKDISPIADQIMAGLSDEAKACVEPVYMSPRETVEHQNAQMLINGYDTADTEDPTLYSDEPILIGFELTDPTLAAKLGVNCMWHSRQTNLVFCQCANSKDDEKAVKVITTIINSAFAEVAETEETY